MLARTHFIHLLVAGAGLLALALPVSAAAEAPTTAPGSTGQSAAPSETSPSATTQAPPAQSPTLTVEPAPTPAPAPRTGSPPGASAPRVHAQRAQGGTRGARARPQVKAGAGSTAGNASGRRGPRAPSPSALTPPLPLAFSASLAGIPTFFIESFRVPPFLLPIFQAAGTAYGVPWQVLAAINEVETDYGRDLSVSSAGAEGWMQFLPSSWATYGVDANGDGFKDPYNPADAIFAAARYLRAAGAATNLRGAIFAYNHSHAYVDSVLLRARLLGGTPSELLGALTGLTQARFPVHAPSHFADGFPAAPARSGHGPTIPGTTIYSHAGAPVIAVQDGRVSRIGESRELGHFISLRDAYGNTYTYARLGRIARFYPVLQPHEGSSAGPPPPRSAEAEPRPTGPATAGVQPRAQAPPDESAAISGSSAALTGGLGSPAAGAGTTRSGGAGAAPATANQPATTAPPLAPTPLPAAAPAAFRAGPNDVYLHPLRRGARVIAGTILGHVDSGARPASESAGATGSQMLFQIRPAGPGAPLIDPKPILDGWVQLENTSIYRASGANPYLASGPSPGQVLLESKQQLEVEVLANRRIDLHRCGRQDVHGGQLDRRVLATIEFLAVSGLSPSVSGLPCARQGSGAEGGAAARSRGEAFDVSAVNGAPIAGHHGPGSIADETMRKLLTLQGPMKPRQIISLTRYPGTDNTVAIASYRDRIHVDFAQPPITTGRIAGTLHGAITAREWIALIARLGEIPSPAVRSGRSAAAIPDHPASGGARSGASGGHG
jgi:hypothetical protein